MGLQARLRGDEDLENRAKGFLKPGGTREEPARGELGVLRVRVKGAQELMLLTPQDDPMYDFKLVEVRLVPEGG
jgi:hypothetical protein